MIYEGMGMGRKIVLSTLLLATAVAGGWGIRAWREEIDIKRRTEIHEAIVQAVDEGLKKYDLGRKFEFYSDINGNRDGVSTKIEQQEFAAKYSKWGETDEPLNLDNLKWEMRIPSHVKERAVERFEAERNGFHFPN